MAHPWRICATPVFKPGDPAPAGYVAWHEWAKVQHRAGLRQRRCGRCSRWFFPQEMSRRTVTSKANTRKDGTGRTVTTRGPVCLKCAPR